MVKTQKYSVELKIWHDQREVYKGTWQIFTHEIYLLNATLVLYVRLRSTFQRTLFKTLNQFFVVLNLHLI